MPDIHLIIDLQVEQVIIHMLFLIKERKAIPQSIQQRPGLFRICIRKGFDLRQGSGVRLPPMIASIKKPRSRPTSRGWIYEALEICFIT